MRVPMSNMSLPIPNLDDKTFDELFEEARALIPRYAPDWTNHNISDPGITLIDLFAWLTEMEIYTLNRINDRNILKFLKLLGEAPLAAKPASVNLEFSLEGCQAEPVEIKKATQAITILPSSNEPLIFETDFDVTVSRLKIAHLFSNDSGRFAELMHSNTSNSSYYFAFGNKASHNSEFYIAFTAANGFPENEISLFINIYQADLPAIEINDQTFTVMPSAKLEWQFRSDTTWQPLAVLDDTVALTQNGRLRFQGSKRFTKANIQDIIPGVLNLTEHCYWIRAVVKKSGYEIPPRIDTILVNAVSATQVKTIKFEVVGKEKIKRQGLPYQTISLQNKPVLAKSLVLKVYEADQIWHTWEEVADFDASKAIDRHYVIDLQTGDVQFGDGIRGRIPPDIDSPAAPTVNSNICAETYQVSGGLLGNVKPDTIQALLIPKNVTVNNPRAANSGTSVETLDSAQHRIRKDLKQPYRAVHDNDFETLAKQTPGLRLQRVKVLPLYHPDYPSIKMPGSVTVVVVPYVLPNADDTTLPIPSQGFLQTVASFLEPRCLVATRLQVIAPEFIGVKVEATLEIAPKKNTAVMADVIKKALRKFLNPNIDTDELDSQGWPFGRGVYKSEIYQVLQGIEGVICVKHLSLSADNCHAKVNGTISIPQIGLVYLADFQPTFREGSN
jgi:predicted phage baseplate assembly protein